MEKVIATRGISYHIEEVLINAQKEIILISPYLKIPKPFYERLINASNRGIKIIIVYGKEDLKKEQEKALNKIENLQIRFEKNLHAKIYLNEQEGVIASMNLYDYSEINNFELGVYFKKVDPKTSSTYTDAYREVQHIISHGIIKKDFLSLKKKDTNIKLILNNDQEDFSIENYPIKGIITTQDYGFITYNLRGFNNKKIKKIRDNTFSLLRDILDNEYRIYWSSPYEKISIYHKKGLTFKKTEDEYTYCENAIVKVNNAMKENFN